MATVQCGGEKAARIAGKTRRQQDQNLLDLTTTPNAVASAVHDRTPVILETIGGKGSFGINQAK